MKTNNPVLDTLVESQSEFINNWMESAKKMQSAFTSGNISSEGQALYKDFFDKQTSILTNMQKSAEGMFGNSEGKPQEFFKEWFNQQAAYAKQMADFTQSLQSSFANFGKPAQDYMSTFGQSNTAFTNIYNSWLNTLNASYDALSKALPGSFNKDIFSNFMQGNQVYAKMQEFFQPMSAAMAKGQFNIDAFKSHFTTETYNNLAKQMFGNFYNDSSIKEVFDNAIAQLHKFFAGQQNLSKEYYTQMQSVRENFPQLFSNQNGSSMKEFFTQVQNVFGKTFEPLMKVVAPGKEKEQWDSCSTDFPVPYPGLNPNNLLYAKDGLAFAGMFWYEPPNFREYAQVQLTQFLEVGKCYFVRFYVVLDPRATVASNNIAMNFSNITYSTISSPTAIPVPMHVTQFNNPIISDTLNWVEVSGLYSPSNIFEKFICIGNFKSDAQTDTLTMNTYYSFRESYYFVDAVSVFSINPSGTLPWSYRDTCIFAGDSVFLGNKLGGTFQSKWYSYAGSLLANAPGVYVKPVVTSSYVVQYSVCGTARADTVKVSVSGPMNLSVAGNSSLCLGENTTLTASGADSYSWSQGSNTASVSLTPSSTSIYTVTGTFTNTGCSSSKSVTLSVMPCLELPENSTGILSKVYPNPTAGEFTIDVDKSCEISVYNHMGELILIQKAVPVKNTIDLDPYGSGIYFIRLSNESGNSLIKLLKN